MLLALQPPVDLYRGNVSASLGVRSDVADDPNRQKTAVRGLRVFPPDEFDPMSSPSEGSACEGTRSN